MARMPDVESRPEVNSKLISLAILWPTSPELKGG